MNKQDVSQRVLQNGKPLSLNEFEWDEKTMPDVQNKINKLEKELEEMK